MRYLLFFMFCVGIFVLGKRSCHISNGEWSFGGGVRGKGPTQTEKRAVSGFHAVDLEIAGDVEVSIAETFSVEVQAQESLLPLLKTEVEDGALRIYFSEYVSHSEDIKVRISGPSFDGLSVGGSGTIRMLTPATSEKMEMDVSGSGDIYLEQATLQSASCAIAGSGTIHLAGTANTVKTDISGSGDIKAKDLTVNDLEVNIAGSGSVTANVVQHLKADISGSGDVFYGGQPAVEANVSGSGSVKKM